MASTTPHVAVGEPNSPCMLPSSDDHETTTAKIHEHDSKVGKADLIVKLMVLSSTVASKRSRTHEWRGVEVVMNFNNLVSRMISKEVLFDDDDLSALRDMLTASVEVLEFTLQNPATKTDQDSTTNYDFHLTIGMVDLLRTACFISSPDNFVREYSKDCRSLSAQARSNTCNIMREEKNPINRESWATGDQMSKNLDAGLKALKVLSLKTNNELRGILEGAWADVSTSITSLVLPMVLDGRRMKALNAINSRFYGLAYYRQGAVYGGEGLLSELFDSSGSMTSVSRVVKTILAIIAMARLNIVSYYTEKGAKEGKTKSECKEDAKMSFEWSEMYNLALSLSAVVGYTLPVEEAGDTEHQGGDSEEAEDMEGEKEHDALDANDAESKKKKTSSSVKTSRLLYETIADWFERAVRNSNVFTVLSSAFMYKAFTPGRIEGRLKDVWDDYTRVENVDVSNGLSLWDVARCLVSVRLVLHRNNLAGSNVLICALACFSGAIGDLMTEKADGPFVFVDRVKKQVDRLYRECFGHTRLMSVKIHARRYAKVDYKGKTCRATTVTNNVAMHGYSRRQKNKTALMHSRLSVSLFMLSIAEEIRKDLFSENKSIFTSKSHVSSLMYEGRKDGRRIYTIALQVQPCVNYTILRKCIGSHLIEESRANPNNVLTTSDNTEKPFRDIGGGAVINTLLYPLAGIAFELAVYSLVENTKEDCKKRKRDDPDQNGGSTNKKQHDMWFKSTTNACVNIFIKMVRLRADRAFDTNKLDETESFGPVRVGAKESKIMMLQQLSFVNKFCDVIENNGSLWEDLQLSLSVHAPSEKDKKKEEDYEDDDDFD